MIGLSVAVGRFVEALFWAIMRVAGWVTVAAVAGLVAACLIANRRAQVMDEPTQEIAEAKFLNLALEVLGYKMIVQIDGSLRAVSSLSGADAWERTMIRTILEGAMFAVTVLSATTAVAPAIAQDYGDPMYERYYYDDAAMTQQVGYEQDTCNRYGVGGGRTQGRYGAVCSGKPDRPLQPRPDRPRLIFHSSPSRGGRPCASMVEGLPQARCRLRPFPRRTASPLPVSGRSW